MKFIPVHVANITMDAEDPAPTLAWPSTFDCMFCTAIDHDDSQTAFSFEQLKNSTTSRVVSCKKSFIRKIIPTFLVPVRGSGISTSYIVKPAKTQWIDCANIGVEYRGLKCCFGAGTTSKLFTYRIETCLYMQFKHKHVAS